MRRIFFRRIFSRRIFFRRNSKKSRRNFFHRKFWFPIIQGNWNIYVLLHFRCYKFHTKILTFWLNFRYLSDILSLICLSSNPLTIYVFENSIFKWIVLRPNQKFRSEKISAKMVAEFFSAEFFSCRNFFRRKSQKLSEIFSAEVFPPKFLGINVH